MKEYKICFLVINEFVFDNDIFYKVQVTSMEGYETVVIALRDRKKILPLHEKKQDFFIFRINLLTRNLPDLPVVKIFRYLEYLIKGTVVALRQRARIYYACGATEMLLLGVIAKRITNSKLIYDPKDFLTDAKPIRSFKDKIESKLAYFLEKNLVNQADKVIVGTDSIGAEFEARYNIALPVTMRVCKPFAMVEGSDKIRRTLNIPSDIKIALYFGDIAADRGLDKLIEAAAYLDNIMLVIIGEGRYKDTLVTAVAKKGLSDKVKFLNRIPLEEVAAYISSADIGVTPMQKTCFNNFYNLENRLFYYISCGLPVASSDTYERKKLIEGYGLGAVFDPDDPKDIAEKINNLLGDVALYERIKKRVIEAAKNDLNLENESRKLLKAYKDLCAQT
jgi:glycosyltransferase involved in cell wall biosynthesis